MMTQNEVERVVDLDCILESYLSPEDEDLLSRASGLGLGSFSWDEELDDSVFSIDYDVLENLRGRSDVGACHDAD